jgi:hypothetical protein
VSLAAEGERKGHHCFRLWASIGSAQLEREYGDALAISGHAGPGVFHLGLLVAFDL